MARNPTEDTVVEYEYHAMALVAFLMNQQLVAGLARGGMPAESLAMFEADVLRGIDAHSEPTIRAKARGLAEVVLRRIRGDRLT